MAHYAIGDIQGCYQEFQLLLEKLDFNHGSDTLWLVGDIVNRGPQSLKVLQFCMRHESSVQMVLGNHDLHLLALMYGYGKLKRSDTLSDILNHPDSKKMRDWLRAQPLMRQSKRYVLAHAGLLPPWTVKLAQQLADEVSEELKGKHTKDYFANMYGNTPTAWSPNLQGYERLRLITNVFTRMRALTFNNELDYDFKAGPEDMPNGLRAWFEAPNRLNTDHTILFGHWSSLGYVDTNNVIALDTGALWGGHLTAVNLADRSITQVPSLKGLDWTKAL
ncbi:symmetrical bis(5'-nucleosyl)-tetraphosphatase [Neisseria wadsworthii]|uniref:Bis(5'-nucleosyl)-tetraphosphatase, symmetrical n=1 Tax=Neisseria wadsworthii 9715 TaxID=1030841 RepID=G4CQ78_9NEIS|nr:symmetrical bis(5'-nucleosyl)-tetraphosphatase [Neisseria wadsworthii]EGZ46806.1 bis(5'-nucleosyl)-tetraphosphatase [Neisseria wadsworthii 9715]QMT35004.1 symmetrical bis(5'-nucleosyl)-tetraphosphatase [Neisseria wadsworthii]